MNNVLYNYLIKNFFKTILLVIGIFYCFGVILNLFEEIEFFKNTNADAFLPLALTSILIPSMIIKLLPFIIFISSMWFMLKIRNNKDLLTLKVFGFSNLKIFFILAFVSFFFGIFILIAVNPITSSLSKYYEKTKSSYARDIDHLITFNKNGLWIRENLENKFRIISATKPDGYNLIDVKIFHLNQEYDLIEKIISKKANIQNNNWVLNDVIIFKSNNQIFEKDEYKEYQLSSIYNYKKINNLFKNFNTMSFIDLVFNFDKLIENGYNKNFLNQSFHTLLTLPLFLFLMTGIASILTFNTLKKSDNLKFLVVGLMVTVFIFYLKDLSLALGQTDRIPLILSIWSPIIALSFFTFMGVLQINEK